MKRRDLLGAALPGAVVGATAVSAVLLTRPAQAAIDPWAQSTVAPLTPEQYRDELERLAADSILTHLSFRANTVGNTHPSIAHGNSLFNGQTNAYCGALRLLGGYGWQSFDEAWASRVIATKGRPRSDAAPGGWPTWPGGPVAGAQVVDARVEA